MDPKKPVPGSKHLAVNRREADRMFQKFEIGLSQALLSLDPKNLAALETLGAALTRAGRHEEAYQTDLKITALAPKSPWAFYNLACSCSNLGQIDDALEALSKALALGYRDFNHMMADADLKNAREDPRFKKLLDRKWGKRQP